MNGLGLSCMSGITLPRILPVLLLLILWTNQGFAVELNTLTSNDQIRYWYDGTIKKQITAVKNELAVIHYRSTPVSKSTQLEMLRASEPGLSVVSEIDNNITRYRVPDMDNARPLSDKLEELRKGRSIKTVSLIYSQDIWSRDDWMLLSGELIIHFRPDWNEARIIEWFEDRNLEIIEKFSFAKNVYKVKQRDEARDSLELANEIYESGEVLFSYPNWINKRVSRVIPNDALINNQWHLINSGQTGGVAFEDINVIDIWDTYKGSSNEVVAIVDDGLEINHEDLYQNIVLGQSYDFIDMDEDPTAGDHGTSVAGLVAAKGNNLTGVSGVAPEAGMVGYRLLPNTTEASEASALSKSTQVVDIYNNSWGPVDIALTLDGPGELTKAAIKNGVMTGRGGAGSIYVWAVGNGGELNDNGNYDGYANSRYTIAVGATTDQGTEANYSEPCSCLIVSAPSDGGGAGIQTTDRTGAEGYEAGNYTSTFGGTSASAPIVSGVIALMLQANPELTWRDVQKILALSATQVDPTDNGWAINGAGYAVNHKFGFGLVNAEIAVRMAEHWLSAGPEIIIDKNASPFISIPDNNSTGVSSSINIQESINVEYVEVTFTSTDHTFRGDLQIDLISPDGTISILGTPRFDPGTGYDHWTFGTSMHLHEVSAGLWTLKVTDQFSDDTGTFESWSLKIYGNNDADGDRITNNLDSDDDNDGIPDHTELANGLDPFNGFDINGDHDGDGYSNNAEYLAGTGINNASDYPVSSIPVMIDDINTTNPGSNPEMYFNEGSFVYFLAQDRENGLSLWRTDGTEAGTLLIKPGFDYDHATRGDTNTFFAQGDTLWRSDGTGAGTQLVVDCWPGGNTGRTDPIKAVGNIVFFWCPSGPAEGLWASDGTTAGSRFLFDPAPSSTGGLKLFGMTAFNQKLIFTAETDNQGWELWQSDGTPGGTQIIRDIVPGSNGSGPTDFFVAGNRFVFQATSADTGRELWVSDGTEAGTVLLKDILPGPANSSINNFIRFNDLVFFTAESPAGNELWVSDGTVVGTHQVKDINPGSEDANPYSLTVFNGRLFFSAASSSINGQFFNYQLWSSDGTEAGTSMVKDIEAGQLKVAGDTLFFLGYDDSTGQELWKSDGTEAGTVLVKDIKSGPSSNVYGNLTSGNGKIYFSYDNGSTGQELWQSDGTEAGTTLLKDIFPGVESSYAFIFASINNHLLITANDSIIGRELWVSDGTSAGTGVLKDIKNTTLGTDIRKIAGFNGTLYIQIDSDLWKSDGSVSDVVPSGNTIDYYSNEFVLFNNDLYYVGGGQKSLWKINGLTGVHERVKDFSSGTVRLDLSAVLDGKLYFAASATNYSEKLWVTDGTEAGTGLVKDISFYSSPKFVVLGNYMYFAANDDTAGVELWKSDGTDSGTTLIKDIYPGTASSFPRELIIYNNELYFTAQSPASATYTGIWKSDGTSDGTVLVKAGSVVFTAQANFTVMGNQLYFKTPNGLWKTDGTTDGTLKIKNVNAWGWGDMTVYNGILYFSAEDSQHGVELWRSDGTSYGTYRLKDINSHVNPTYSSLPNNFLVANGILYFTAMQHTSETTANRQIWSTDGTRENTRKLTRQFLGVGSAITLFNNSLYFSADTLAYGHELHVLSLDADGDGISDASDNCTLDPDVVNLNTDNDAFCNTADIDDDNDGIPDSYEITNGLNPLLYDSFTDLDADGLTNLQEFQLGTSVTNSDTDNDGMQDYYEVNNSLDPLNDDSSGDRDADGLANLEEFILGTSADNSDTDHDGKDDNTEVDSGTNPLGLRSETDLIITQTVNTQIPTPGSPVEFQIKVTNDGTQAASGIVVTDLLPKGMKIPSGMAPFVSQGTYSPETGKWLVGSLLGGRTAILTIPAIPLQYQQQQCFVNNARITEYTANDIRESNNLSLLTVFVGGASSCAQLKYSVSPGNISIQECTGTNRFDFKVAIDNAGPNIARNVKAEVTGIYKTIPVTGSSPVINQVLPGGKVDAIVSLNVPCGQSPTTASYTLNITSSTLLSTDSNISGSGTVDVPDTGICSCVIPPASASPVNTVSVTASGDGGGGGGGGCFIATAAYGSYMHPYVVELRIFRDNVLMKSSPGREFISLYYKYSPPLAEYISEHEAARIFVRFLLTPLVFVLAYPLIVLLVFFMVGLIFYLKTKSIRVRFR